MGYLKLDRQIVDSAIWDNGEPFDVAHAWIDLLLLVNYTDGQRMIKEKFYNVPRGSQIVSDNFLANRWHWSRNRVRRFLESLEANNMVTLKRTTNGTWLNVVNYAKFQDRRTTNGTANGTSDDTTDDTTDGTSDGTQEKKNKKNKKDNNFLCGADAQKKIPPSKDEVEGYCRENGFRFDIDEFMAYYNLNGWTLSGGRKITDWTAAVDYWAKKGTKIDKASDDLTKTMPMYQEFSTVSTQVGVDQPFEGGLVQEMLKRKRTKKNAG